MPTNPTDPIKQEDYLGDGVYASSTGEDITLDLRGQDDTTVIVLEPFVLEALDRFRSRFPRLMVRERS